MAMKRAVAVRLGEYISEKTEIIRLQPRHIIGNIGQRVLIEHGKIRLIILCQAAHKNQSQHQNWGSRPD